VPSALRALRGATTVDRDEEGHVHDRVIELLEAMCARNAVDHDDIVSILFTATFAPVATIVILLVLRAVFGSLRLDEESEFLGVDLSEHSETAYMFGSASGSPATHTSQVQGAPLASPVKARA